MLSARSQSKSTTRESFGSRSNFTIMDSSLDSRRHANENEPELSPTEQAVLDEYAKLVGNLDNVRNGAEHYFWTTLTSMQLSEILAELAANPSLEILDSLRGLERKTATVFTLLKASVYSIVLQQEIRDEDVGSPQV